MQSTLSSIRRYTEKFRKNKFAKNRLNIKKQLTKLQYLYIITSTEPDTPLVYDADHVGSFLYLGEIYGRKAKEISISDVD